jgi:hypothetical protein
LIPGRPGNDNSIVGLMGKEPRRWVILGGSREIGGAAHV